MNDCEPLTCLLHPPITSSAYGMCSDHISCACFVLPACSDEKYKQSMRTAKGSDRWLDVSVWNSATDCAAAVKVCLGIGKTKGSKV